MHTCSTMLIQSPSVWSLSCVTTCFTGCIRCILDLLCQEFDTNQVQQPSTFKNPLLSFSKDQSKNPWRQALLIDGVCVCVSLPWHGNKHDHHNLINQGKVVKSQTWLRYSSAAPSEFIIFCWLPFSVNEAVNRYLVKWMRRGVDVGLLWCVLLLWLTSCTLSNPFWILFISLCVVGCSSCAIQTP